MEAHKTFEQNNDCITIEATVPTGFEFLAMDEVKEKCQPALCSKSKGKIFFNIPSSKYDKVLGLRSIDNLSLVMWTNPDVSLKSDKEQDLEVLKTLVDEIAWAKYVRIWADLRKWDGLIFLQPETTPEEQEIIKYRVTCNRVGTHSFSSMEAAWHFGGAIQDKFKWKVDLSNFDIEVVLNISSNCIYTSASLTKESLHRRNITHFGSTTLRSTMCYGLLRLTEPVAGEIIMDPLCGGASIPIEGSLSFPYTFHICGDNDEKAKKRSAGNIEYLLRRQDSVNVDFCQWSAKGLPLKDSSIDIVVTDLPFGKRSGKKKDNRPLYIQTLTELARVVRPKTGRVSLLTGDKAALIQAINKTQNYWRTVRSFGVNQGGLSAVVFLLLRTAADFIHSSS